MVKDKMKPKGRKDSKRSKKPNPDDEENTDEDTQDENSEDNLETEDGKVGKLERFAKKYLRQRSCVRGSMVENMPYLQQLVDDIDKLDNMPPGIVELMSKLTAAELTSIIEFEAKGEKHVDKLARALSLQCFYPKEMSKLDGTALLIQNTKELVYLGIAVCYIKEFAVNGRVLRGAFRRAALHLLASGGAPVRPQSGLSRLFGQR